MDMKTEKKQRINLTGQMGMLDMHAHLSCLSGEYARLLLGNKDATQEELNDLGKKETDLRKQHNITTCFSCTTPGEWEYMQRFFGEKQVLLSFGIHPWYAERFIPKDWMTYLESCKIIGEIGMDSVWCEVPLGVQKQVFKAQLQIAEDLQKPVILHTKGQEKEIADMLEGFTQKVCVHWYSGDIETFERFLDMDSYFTLGPDFARVCSASEAAPNKKTSDSEEQTEQAQKQELYKYMLKKIPLNRLFLETDGLSAVAWARNTDVLPIEEIPAVLTENLVYLANKKEIPPEKLQGILNDNLIRFLS